MSLKYVQQWVYDNHYLPEIPLDSNKVIKVDFYILFNNKTRR